MAEIRLDSSSFRDPNGFVFYKGNRIYRQISNAYQANYDWLMDSGLYAQLTNEGLLITHNEASRNSFNGETYKIISPQKIPFISYPYEWSFSQLKDAALTTLRVQKIALKHSMSLKDASSFNIQFLNGKPILIDTLSFEKYEEGKP